jgi:hypothetical protein
VTAPTFGGQTTHTAADHSGSWVKIVAATQNTPAQYVAVFAVNSDSSGYADTYVDRTDAIRLRGALTEAIDAHVEREAAKVKKLNRGDRVTGRSTRGRYTVVTDETEDGRVDLVSRQTGHLLTNRVASAFIREATHHYSL